MVVGDFRGGPDCKGEVMGKLAAVAAVILLFVSPAAVFAQRGTRAAEAVEIRVASPVPRNSDWGRTLDRIAGEWARVTNNYVRPRVIHDGLEGGESRMLSSLSTNHIQAALLTSAGLADIVPEVMSLSVPFQIRDDAELDLVLRDILPVLEEKAGSTNFVVLTWSRAGWISLFSREPILEPDDLRRMRLSTNADTANMNAVFRNMGFTLVETEIQDMGPMIANGAVTAVYATPAAIAPLALHRTLGHMLDMPIAPFLGAIVINRVTWDRLGPQHQRAMIDVTRRIAAEFDSQMPRTVANAVTMMQRDGLTVNVPSAGQRDLWQGEVQRAMPPLLGPTFDREMHGRIAGILERSRNGL